MTVRRSKRLTAGQGVRVNWDNPLSRGLKLLVIPGASPARFSQRNLVMPEGHFGAAVSTNEVSLIDGVGPYGPYIGSNANKMRGWATNLDPNATTGHNIKSAVAICALQAAFTRQPVLASDYTCYLGFTSTGEVMINDSSIVVASGTTSVPLGEWVTIGGRYRRFDHGVWLNGIKEGVNTGTSDFGWQNDSVFYLLGLPTTHNHGQTLGSFFAAWGRELEDFEMSRVTKDPWDLVESVRRRAFVWVSAGAGGPAAQNVTASGIASAEAFGAPRIDLSIAPAGIASANAFGAARLDLNIAPVGIATSEAFGTADVQHVLSITAEGIASVEAFGTAQLNMELLPASITSAEAFGSAQLNMELLPSGIASTAAVGEPALQIVTSLYPEAIASAEAFGTPQLGMELLASGIASAEAFGTPNIQNATVFASAIGSSEAFGTPTVTLSGGATQDITVTGFANTSSFGTLIASMTVNVDSFANTTQFGTASLVGQTNVLAESVVNASSYGDPYLYNTLQMVYAEGIASGESVSQAYLSGGDAPLVFYRGTGTPRRTGKGMSR